MNSAHVGKNVRRLMKLKGKTITEMAGAIGLSSVALSNILAAKSAPKSGTLIKLSAYLHVPIDSLFIAPVALHSVRFRSLHLLSAREKAAREQVLVDVPHWLMNYQELERLLGRSNGHSLPDVAGLNEREAAHRIREIANMNDEEPISDVVELVSLLGIKIRLHDFGMRRLFGLSIGSTDGGPAVVVNDNAELSIERKIFTIAHELGHLLLHHDSYDEAAVPYGEDESEEIQANAFAGELLLPSAGLKKQWENYKGLSFVDRVLAIKHVYKVSYKTVLYGMGRDGLCKGEGAQLYMNFAQGYKDCYGHDLKNHFEPSEGMQLVAGVDPEPLQRWDLLSTEYEGLVRDAFKQGHISLTKAAELLSLDVAAMRKLQASWECDGDA